MLSFSRISGTRHLPLSDCRREMERMAQHTQRPELLREIFAALRNDPAVIAECLVRPALARGMLTQRYANDERFHGELRRGAEAELRAFHSIEEMKGTSGKYREIEWIRTDKDKTGADGGAGGGLELNAQEWTERTQKLKSMFLDAESDSTRLPESERLLGGNSPPSTAPIRTGIMSQLQEDEERYYAIAVVSETEDRLRLAVVEWPKRPFDSWRASNENGRANAAPGAMANYALPALPLAGNDCTDDTWTPTLNVPGARLGHTAVWTGSEMIVWGEQGPNGYHFLAAESTTRPQTHGR